MLSLPHTDSQDCGQTTAPSTAHLINTSQVTRCTGETLEVVHTPTLTLHCKVIRSRQQVNAKLEFRLQKSSGTSSSMQTSSKDRIGPGELLQLPAIADLSTVVVPAVRGKACCRPRISGCKSPSELASGLRFHERFDRPKPILPPTHPQVPPRGQTIQPQ